MALGAGLALTACGGDEPASDASAEVSQTEHGAADVAFAQDMVQHHAQALVMVDLTAGRPLDPEVAALAEQIRAAQAPEIEQMAGWLLAWGEEVPATVRDHASAGHGGDHTDAEHMEGMEGMEGMDMPGMMSGDEMAALAAAPDSAFQELWLEMMVEHHEGAVEMARTQQQEGRYAPAVELAEAVEASQTAEIEQMRALLG
nr:DUF305 domain-containing protein [Nocardioides perillae]